MASHIPRPGFARAGSLAIWRRIGVSVAGVLAVCLILLAGMPADAPPTATEYGESTASQAPSPPAPARSGVPDEAKLRRLVRVPAAPKADGILATAAAISLADIAMPPPRRIGPSRFTPRPLADPPRQRRHSRAPPLPAAG